MIMPAFFSSLKPIAGSTPVEATGYACVTTGDNPGWYIYTTGPDTLLTTIDAEDIGVSAAFSPGGQYLAVGDTGADGFIRILDVPDFTDNPSITPDPLPNNNITHMEFSNNGDFLVIGLAVSPYMVIYNTADWSAMTPPVTMPAGRVIGVKFSPDDTICAVPHDSSPRITFYDTTSDPWVKMANPTTLPTGNPFCAEFSPDGAYVFIGHFTTPYITAYNTSSWAKLTNPSTLPEGPVSRILSTASGSQLLCFLFLDAAHNFVYDFSAGAFGTKQSYSDLESVSNSGGDTPVLIENGTRVIMTGANDLGSSTVLLFNPDGWVFDKSMSPYPSTLNPNFDLTWVSST